MKYRVLILLMVMMVQGCSSVQTTREQVNLKILSGSNLAYLDIGRTKIEDVLLKMGEPSSTYNDKHIVIYQVLEQKKGKFIVVTPRNKHFSELRQWWDGVYSLVMVFSDKGILTKMSMVGSK